MRIISGKWGGVPLVAPKSDATRPTSDGNREAMFNVIEHGLGHEMGHVIDFFAGTGALSFEALSRGAQTAVLFESDRKAIAAIERNREKLKVDAGGMEIYTEARLHLWPTLLRKLCDTNYAPIDTIFCDPPYGKGLGLKAFRALASSPDLLAPQCLFIAEISSTETPWASEGWKIAKDWKRGVTRILFYQRA